MLLISLGLLEGIVRADWSSPGRTFVPSETVVFGSPPGEEDWCSGMPGQLVVAAAVLWILTLVGASTLLFLLLPNARPRAAEEGTGPRSARLFGAVLLPGIALALLASTPKGAGGSSDGRYPRGRTGTPGGARRDPARPERPSRRWGRIDERRRGRQPREAALKDKDLKHLETRATLDGVVRDLDVSRVALTGIPNGPDTLSRIFAALAEADVPVDVIAESASKGGTSDVAFTVGRACFPRARRLAGRMVDSLGGCVEGEENLGKVSVVGTGMLNRPGYAARVFDSLGRAGIPIRAVSTSEVQLTCVVPVGRIEEAVLLLREEFGLEERDV